MSKDWVRLRKKDWGWFDDWWWVDWRGKVVGMWVEWGDVNGEVVVN